MDFAVQQDSPRTILETDGHTVTRSTDAGCTSARVYTSPTLPGGLDTQVGSVASAGVSTIVDLEMDPEGGPQAMALMDLGFGGVGGGPHHTLVAASSNGVDWTTGQAGAPLLGAPLRLVIANTNQSYVLTQATAGSMVWASSSGGTAWTLGATGLPFTDLSVDPNHPNHLYGWGEQGLFESTDAGVSFARVGQIAGAVNDVRSYQIDQLSLVEVAMAGGGLLIGVYSASPGATVTWQHLRSAGIDQLDRSAGLGLGAPLAFVLNDFVTNGAYYIGQRHAEGTLSTFPRTPSGAGKVRRPQSAEGGWLHVMDSAGLWRAHVGLKVGRDGLPFPEIAKPSARDRLIDVTIGDTTVRQRDPATLLPRRQTITLKPGQAKTIPLKLLLPAVPTPLDVMFLVDTTSSMQPTIDGLKTGIGQIITDFVSSGIDVHFGVADFQDYPVSPWGCPGSGVGGTLGQQNCEFPDHIYKRFLPISAPGPGLATALKALRLNSGGDGSEGTLGGVYQAATGEGQQRTRGVPGSGYFAQPNQGANFRPGAVKVLVVATDSRFHVPRSFSEGQSCLPAGGNSDCNGEVGYPGPGFEQVIAALNERNIRVVGLDVSGQSTESLALRDEARLAAGTATFAPPGGVDCDDDGITDIAPGKPLACPIETTGDSSALNLAPAIVSLIRALRDLATVRFTLVAESGPKVAKLTPSVVPSVDVKANNSLRLSAKLACPSGEDGQHPMRVLASVGGEAVASAHLTLDCIGPKPIRSVVVIPPLVPPVAPPAPPGAPPPAQPNANPNPQLNPQLGAASQKQEEPQLAAVDSEVGSDDDAEAVGVEAGSSTLSMSAYEPRTHDTGPAWAYELAVLGLMTAAAASHVVRSRRKVYFASSEVRDSRTTVTRI